MSRGPVRRVPGRRGRLIEIDPVLLERAHRAIAPNVAIPTTRLVHDIIERAVKDAKQKAAATSD